MKVAMFCLEFPPVNTTGNYRSAGFARYICNHDVETIVLTGTVDTLEKTFGKKREHSLLKGLEKSKIHRFPISPMKPFWAKGIGNKFRIWWNTTDKIDKRWYFGENKKLIDKIIKTEKPDILYVSLPPFSMARTAIEISKKFNIPLVTDMRDAWSLWVSSPFSTRLHYNKILNLERSLFKQSKLILGVTPELIEDFKAQHPTVSGHKFKVIFNGYDDLKFKKESIKTDKYLYKIGYIGSFYFDPASENLMRSKWIHRKGHKKLYYIPRKEEWKYRSPFFFLKALATLIQNDPILKTKIVFEYIGSLPSWMNPMIENLDLKDNFVSYGFVPKQEVLKIQSSWDAILATSEKVINGQHFCLPSKLFDVVNSGKRILGFLTPGSQLNFLKNYSQVIFFQPDAIDNNTLILRDLIKNKDGNFKSDKLSFDFHRENTAKQFYDALIHLNNDKAKGYK